jgi:hypothetical protein
MRNCVSLVADEIVQAVGAVCVNEAIADPGTCSYAVLMSALNHMNVDLFVAIPLVDVADNLESGLCSIFVNVPVLHRL